MTKCVKAKQFKIVLITSFLATLLSYTSTGQEYYFKSLTVNEGLSQDDVNSIVQDSFGFIWLGSFDGLNRFDGVTVQSFHRETINPESLPDNRISALAEDNQKRLWIGTQAGYFSYYSLLEERFFSVKSPENTGLIHSFLVTNDGTLYATSSNGIYKLKEDPKPVFELVTGTQNLNLRGGEQDVNGDLYFVGSSGAFIMKNDLLREIPNPNNYKFMCINQISDSSLIAGSTVGLCSISKESISKISDIGLPEPLTIPSLLVDLDGNIWVGSQGQGLFLFDKSFGLVKKITASIYQPRGLLSNTILDMFLDKKNNLWIGNRHGVCYTSLNRIGFGSLSLKDKIRSDVRNMLVDGDQVLFGINSEGLYSYDLSIGKLERVLPQRINYITEITKIDDVVYVCTGLGLFASKDHKPFERITINSTLENELGNPFRCIVKDDFSRKFLGVSDGIIVWEDNEMKWIWQETPSLKSLKGIFVFRMYYDPNKRQLLIGTISRGLFLLDMDQKGVFSGLKKGNLVDINSDPIFNTSVWCFHEDKHKVLWIGTDLGLFKRNPDSDTFEQIPEVGIQDKKIMSISESEDGTLWLSNTHGLICYNSETGKVRKYTREDGLLSSSLTEAKGKYGDTLFFGTTHGLNFIEPSQILSKPNSPEILISKFKINNEVVKPNKELAGSVVISKNINSTEQLNLNYLQNNFSMEYSGTNYSNSSKNIFRYRLEGFDDKWIYTTVENRTLSYSNLDPGQYKLYLEIANNYGEWSEKSLMLPIKITPAPWMTPLAYTFYTFILLFISGGFVYFWYNKQILNHQIMLDQIKINQDRELRDRQLRFFADVAHEFKTPLSLILAPFNEMMNRTLSHEKKDMFLQIISRNIQRMNFLVGQLLDFDKISEGKKEPRVIKKDIALSIRHYVKSFQWHVQNENIDLRMNLDNCSGYFDPDILEKGLYNVLSNAFKHTPKGGIIEISLKQVISSSNEFAIITVSDSGSGIPDEQKEHVFERFYHGKDRASSGIGLHLTQHLIKVHGGTISVEDSIHGGTQFTITLPISKNNYTHFETDIIEEKSMLQVVDGEQFLEPEHPEKEETILIVEDDHDLRNYLKISLQADFSVIEASNGQQGLLEAQQNLPDIVISDVMMPIMGGIEMCKELKNNKDTSHIPILMLTAKADAEYQKKGLEAGAWDYITKPFDTEALLRKVMNILETRNKFKSYLIDHNINSEVQTHYTSYDQKLLKSINQIIEDNLENTNFNVNELATEVGLSRMHLHRKLKTLTGETAKNIITRVKIKYAVSMFDQGCDRIQEAMNAIGMSNYSNFNNNFKKIMNMTATEYLANKKNESE